MALALLFLPVAFDPNSIVQVQGHCPLPLPLHFAVVADGDYHITRSATVCSPSPVFFFSSQKKLGTYICFILLKFVYTRSQQLTENCNLLIVVLRLTKLEDLLALVFLELED